MPIIGALVSRGTVVLSEYCQPGTNFPTISRKLCAQIPSTPDSKNSYNYEQHNFNYLVEGGITYICMTDQEMKLRISYGFLFDISNRFRTTYREKIQTAVSMAMNDTFSRVLRDRMDFFSNDKNADKIGKVKGEIEEAKTIMVQNIDKVLARSEKIEMLVSKTDELHQQSQSFKKKSTQLKRKMCCKNARLCCILILVLVIIIAVVTLFVMWHFGIFTDIKRHHDSESSTSTSTSTSSSSTTSTPQSLTTGLASITSGGVATTNAEASFILNRGTFIRRMFRSK